MKPQTIYCVVGDIGGAKEVMLVSRELERRGAVIKWFLDSSPKAKAGDVLKKAGIAYETREPNENDKMGMILIGTSATAMSAQMEWTKWGKERGVPVLWMEDLHGTGSRANSRSVAPDAMLVIDEMAEKIAQKIRPNLRTFVVGKPTFSDPKEMPNRDCGDDIRYEIYDKLNLHCGKYGDEKDKLVVIGFGGDPAERAEAQLGDILKEMTNWIMKDEIVVAWRFHPKHPKKEEMYLQAMVGTAVLGIRTVDARAVDMNHLTIAAHLCVADWGNTNQLVGLLHRTPVVTMLFPEDARLIETYPPDGVPPVLESDYRWGVKNAQDLTMMVNWVLTNHYWCRLYSENLRLEYRDRAFKTLMLPRATERAADIIMANLVSEVNSTALETQGAQGSAEASIAPECGNCGCEHG